MSGLLPRFQLTREPGWYPLVSVVPYVLLAVLVAVTVALKRTVGGSLGFDLGLCALLAVWMLVMYTLRPAWRKRAPIMAVFVTGVIIINAVLVVRDAWFGCLVPAGYIYSFNLLSWPWRLAGVAGVAMVAGTAQSSAVDKSTSLGLAIYLGVLAANVLPMCGFAWLARNADERNDQRNRVLAEVSEANRKLAATLAENAELQEQLVNQAREAGVLDERQRMAREIHDTLAQGLTGIITQLQAAELAEDDPATWRRHLAAATNLARESLTEARRSVHALRPEPLRTGRLGEALAEVAQRWSERNGLAVEVTTTGTVQPLPQEVEIALLRIAQEALANVAKHARATRVGVTLSYLEHQVALDVRDDGGGFDPTRIDEFARRGPRQDGTSGGFGLVSMRQRIEALSGTLQIESEPGVGTAISASVPTESVGAKA
jgi:signal transduction histidine kinase